MSRRLNIVVVMFLIAMYSNALSAMDCDVGKAPTVAQNLVDHANTQFDFLLGEHSVTLHGWSGTKWTPPRPVNAGWRGWLGLQGHVVYDEWIDPDPARGGLGVNVRMFDDVQKIWKMMWISTNGRQVQDLRAQVQAGILTMWQVYPARPGWKAEFEVFPSPEAEGDGPHWARTSFKQDADGQWQPEFRLVATRSSCTLSAE